MLSLKSQAGKQTEWYQEEVTAERISNFCKAVGSPDSEQAPPTFLTVFRRSEFDLFKQLGFELSQVLHAEQEYEYETGLWAGDQVEFKTTLSQVLEKQGAKSFMQFLTFETEFYRKTKQVKIGKSKTTIVIRGSK